MSYKTILVHVDESIHVDARIDIAARIALAENAHLIGAATSGISMFLQQTASVDADYPAINPYLDILRQRAGNALEKFDRMARRSGVLSFEKRLIDDEAASGMSLHAHYCDLVVIGQTDPDRPSPLLGPDFPEHVALHSGCPVLIIPYAGTFKNVGTTVLVAWDASMEARRAVRDALPLLKRAQMVQVAIINPAAQAEIYGQRPGADIALYLARHDVKVSVREEVSDDDIGNTLLSLAADSASDLLIMGCFGHSRLRETLLGGATRTILKSMTLPVLMSH